MDLASVVRIESQVEGEHRLLGTGFVVGSGTLIATCKHVTDLLGEGTLTVRYANWESSAARPVKDDGAADIALLRADFPPQLLAELPVVALSGGDPAELPVGSEVNAYGYSWQKFEKAQCWHGTVAGWDMEGGEYVLSADLNPGDSGGPLERNGVVVGIVRGKHRSNQGQAKAIPTVRLRDMLTKAAPQSAAKGRESRLDAIKRRRYGNELELLLEQYESQAKATDLEPPGAEKTRKEQVLRTIEGRITELESKLAAL
jgi:S1-C subfamily serine protease